MALVVEDIEIRRGGARIVAGLSFAVAEGEAAVLRGPNGSGKSTVLRALAGLLPTAGGRISLNGETAISEHAAYAGHLDAVKPVLSVRGNLAAWAAIYGADPARVAPALAHFSLSHIADAPAAYCSAGQKRRLGLARLLVADRRLWLLDEPTVSLDAASSEAFAAAVATHCAAGGLAVAATHIDLGLPPGPTVTLSRPSAARADEADPFLSGAWA